MKNLKTIMILSIILGILLLPFAYFSFLIGFVLAFAKDGWFMYSSFIFASLGVAYIIVACIAKKYITPLKIVSIITNIFLLACIVYLLTSTLLTDAIWVVIIYLIMFIFGLITTSFIFKSKKDKTHSNETTT